MNPATGSDQLLAFIRFLRGRDLPVSPADTLDAVHVASLLGYGDREVVKNGLASVFAKSHREQVVFEEAFEAFFGPSESESEAPAQSTADSRGEAGPESEMGTAPEGSGTNPGGGGGSPLDQLAQSSDAIAQLLQDPLVQALRGNDEAELSLRVEQAAAAADIDSIRLFTQRGQYTRRMLDALGEQTLRDAAIDLENNQPAAFEQVQQLREQLRERVRNRVERAYLVNAYGDTEQFLDKVLSEVRLGNVNPHQMARLRKLIDRMARKLASRHGRRRRKTRRGQLNVPATLRGAAATDGIPFEPRWRRVERRRPQIMAICDVSGSVAAYAKFLLMFLYAVQDVLPRTRSFAFSAQLGEVTSLFDTMPVEEAIHQVNRLYGGATDYGRALEEFTELALHDVNRATTVVILGDARNNDSDPRLDLIAEIKARCRRLIWLNPEPRSAWGTGDSAMLPVIRHCHIAAECNNLKQLERIVDKLLSDMKGS